MATAAIPVAFDELPITSALSCDAITFEPIPIALIPLISGTSTPFPGVLVVRKNGFALATLLVICVRQTGIDVLNIGRQRGVYAIKLSLVHGIRGFRHRLSD